MAKIDRERILEFFDTRLDEHGKSHKSLDYGSTEVQELRFDILLQIGNLENCKILDVGCGLGDLYGYIRKKGLNVEYVGSDINPRMIELCKETYPEARFEVYDVAEEKISDEFDYIISCGVFSVGFGGDLDKIQGVLQSYYDSAKKGVACNFISTLGDFQNPEVNYFEPADVINHIKKITRQFVIRHDYLPHDFSLYLYK